MIGFSLRDEGALLVGGPEGGQVVKVQRGERRVLVAEEVEPNAAEWMTELTSPSVTAPRHRIGLYERQGSSSNFYWQGWR